jgi:hypothetical protein
MALPAKKVTSQWIQYKPCFLTNKQNKKIKSSFLPSKPFYILFFFYINHGAALYLSSSWYTVFYHSSTGKCDKKKVTEIHLIDIYLVMA